MATASIIGGQTVDKSLYKTQSSIKTTPRSSRRRASYTPRSLNSARSQASSRRSIYQPSVNENEEERSIREMLEDTSEFSPPTSEVSKIGTSVSQINQLHKTSQDKVDALNFENEVHVPYRARQTNPNAKKQVMLEAFARYEQQMEKESKDREHAAHARAQQLAWNDHIEERVDRKKYRDRKRHQNYLKSQMKMNNERRRMSVQEDKQKDDFTSPHQNIGIPTNHIMMKERTQRQALHRSLEQQLHKKSARESIERENDLNEERRMIAKDVKKAADHELYISKKKRETQQMLQNAWDHQLELQRASVPKKHTIPFDAISLQPTNDETDSSVLS